MKKVLSLLLAVTMLFSMFAIASSAVINNGAIIAIKAAPTGDSYKPGDVITFEVSMQNDANIAPDGIGGGTYVFGYNSAVLEPIVDLSSKVDDYAAAGVIVDGYAFGETGYIIPAASYVKLAPDTIVQADLDKGWDKAIHINLGTKAGVYKDFSTETKVFAFQMKVKADAAAGSYEIGINETSTGAVASKTWIDDIYGGFSGADASELGLDPGPVFDRQVSTFKIGGDPIVWKQNQVRPAESGLADAIDIGVKAEFSADDIAIDFDQKGTSTNYKTVGAELQVNGAPAGTGESAFVYEVEGNYQYRVIIKDVAKDSTDVYTLKFFAKDMNDNITYGETVEVSVADCDLTKLPA